MGSGGGCKEVSSVESTGEDSMVLRGSVVSPEDVLARSMSTGEGADSSEKDIGNIVVLSAGV